MNSNYLLFVFIYIFTLSLQGQQFEFPILVSDSINNSVVSVGIHPNGSNGYDAGIDVYAPPPPPTGAFDVRLRINNEDYIKDIRDNSINEKEFTLLYRPQSGYSITLYWDNQILDSLGTFIITDNITGNQFNLDMSTINKLEVNNIPALANGVRILITPSPVGLIDQSDKKFNRLTYFHVSPNPFNNRINIGLKLLKPERINLFVYNTYGQLVQTLIKENLTTGLHMTKWKGINQRGETVTSGQYYLVLIVGNQIHTKKIILFR